MMHIVIAMGDFILAALNTYFAVKYESPFSWAVAVFCFGVGIIVLANGGR